MELITLTIISTRDITQKENFVQRIGQFKLQSTKSNTIISCSVGGYFEDLEKYVYEFNARGPVYGPNGQLELDPTNDQCGYFIRPVFATCKNNCPGGEFYKFLIIATNISRQTECFFSVEKYSKIPVKY